MNNKENLAFILLLIALTFLLANIILTFIWLYRANTNIRTAMFVGVIAAIIGKAMPIGALSMVAITLVAVTGVTADVPENAIKDALSSFANPLIWLIGASIMISHKLLKTGLGARIGYFFIALFGRKTLGIGYNLTLSEQIGRAHV